LALVIVVFIRIIPFDIRATVNFRPYNWAEMSFTVGASILSLVGIITQFLNLIVEN